MWALRHSLPAPPQHPFPGPRGDAWVLYTERVHLNIKYRSFLHDNPHYGHWADIGWPSDGSPPFNFLTCSFPKITVFHCAARAVSLLYGVPKRGTASAAGSLEVSWGDFL
jgi:hypothetical protein